VLQGTSTRVVLCHVPYVCGTHVYHMYVEVEEDTGVAKIKGKKIFLYFVPQYPGTSKFKM
jgi:hypothetical protein